MRNKRRSMLGGIVVGLAGMGLLGIIVAFTFAMFMVAMALYGLWLAFSASIILGILVLIVEPSPVVIGLVMFFWDKNLAQMLVDFLNK